MPKRLNLNEVVVDVVRKNIKNVHLSVNPPSGRVRIAAPKRMSINTVRAFAISKLSWIRKQREKLQEQDRETPREYLDRESHYAWGSRYLLKIIEVERVPTVEISHRSIILYIRPKSMNAKRKMVLEEWYRSQLRNAALSLISKWEQALNLRVKRLFVQRMKTKWGSCNQRAGTIRLNTDLAKKPRECLNYILAHEMLHLIERTHNDRFIKMMDQLLPNWRSIRQTLNELPLPTYADASREMCMQGSVLEK